MLLKCSNVDMRFFKISLYYFFNICRVHSNIFIFIPIITYLWYSPTTVIFLASFFFLISFSGLFREPNIWLLLTFLLHFFFLFCWFLLLSLPFSFFCFFLEGWLIAVFFFSKGFLNRSLSLIFIFYAFLIYKFKSIHFSLSMVLAVSHYDSVKNIL